jgi:hypothetical protein
VDPMLLLACIGVESLVCINLVSCTLTTQDHEWSYNNNNDNDYTFPVRRPGVPRSGVLLD